MIWWLCQGICLLVTLPSWYNPSQAIHHHPQLYPMDIYYSFLWFGEFAMAYVCGSHYPHVTMQDRKSTTTISDDMLYPVGKYCAILWLGQYAIAYLCWSHYPHDTMEVRQSITTIYSSISYTLWENFGLFYDVVTMPRQICVGHTTHMIQSKLDNPPPHHF